MGVAETWIDRSSAVGESDKGDLYLLAIGVNEFPKMPEANLDYAAMDAEAITAAFEGLRNVSFNKVHSRVLSDFSSEKPDKATVLTALKFVKQATARDTVILFLASHGLSDKAGNYYFVPRDGEFADIQRLLDGSSDAPSLIRWESFFDALRQTAGKRLLLVDTCQAKNIQGTLDFHSLSKRSATSKFSVFAASKGSEESQEYRAGNHGLFTYALLEGLKGQGDADQDGNVTLNELFGFVSGYVQENREIKELPQTPQLDSPDSLKDLVLSSTVAH